MSKNLATTMFISVFLIVFSSTAQAISDTQNNCKVYGTNTGANSHYAFFTIEGLNVPISTDHALSLDFLPFDKIDRLPLSYVEVEKGYLWQGYEKANKMGLYFFQYGTKKESLIKRGNFVLLFEIKGNLYTVENIHDGNEQRPLSVLYNVNKHDFSLNKVKEFEGAVGNVFTKEIVLNYASDYNDSTFYLIGWDGWAYQISANKENGFLNCGVADK